MTMFYCAILFMSVRTNQTMMNTNGLKESGWFLAFTTPINLNRFNFEWKLTLNKSLKLMKNRVNIRLGNERVIPYIFCVCINKDNKITKTIKWKRRARSQTSLKINSSGAEVLWPKDSKDKRNDFPNGQLWHWK